MLADTNLQRLKNGWPNGSRVRFNDKTKDDDESSKLQASERTAC